MKTPDGIESRHITVMVVDDNLIYRDGLCDLLAHQRDFEIVAAASNGSEAVEMFHTHRPDIVLMDVCMPVMGGPEAARLILQKFPEARIVMLTVSNSSAELLEAIQSGACGYILKEASWQQLQHLILGWAGNGLHHYSAEKPGLVGDA